MKKNILFISVLILFCILSCTNSESSEDNEDYNDDGQELSEEETDSKFEDGTHSATVDYYNPETGYSESYTLDVEVENGEVNEINFPNGGHLDEDHITAEELDEDGNASVDGEDGKTYDISIDN